MFHRRKSRLAVAAAAGTFCALAAAGAAVAAPTTNPPWSKHNPAIPSAFTNATPGLAQIALTGKNVPGIFVTWKGQFDSRVHYKFRISGKWSRSEVIPHAFTNTSPAAAFYTDLKGFDSELVVWKQLNGGRIYYSQGIALGNGTINWTYPKVMPGGKYSTTSKSPAVLFPLNGKHPRVIVAFRGPYDHVRYEIGTETGPNGRSFTWGTRKVRSAWISPGTKTDPTLTGAGPALTEIVTGGTGTVYVFWKGEGITAPIDYATTPDLSGSGLQGNATIGWTLHGSVPAWRYLAGHDHGRAGRLVRQRARHRPAAAGLQGPERLLHPLPDPDRDHLERAIQVRQRHEQHHRRRPGAG